MGDIDVTGNIRVIERLKSGLLSGVAELYANMLAHGGESAARRPEILAELVVLVYALANRLGIAPSALESKVSNKLRIIVLDEHDLLRTDAQAIAAHFDRKRGGYK